MKKVEHKLLECKRCSKCKKWLPLNCFFKDKNSCDGFYHKCKDCRKERNLKRIKEIKEYNKQYHKNHYVKKSEEKLLMEVLNV